MRMGGGFMNGGAQKTHYDPKPYHGSRLTFYYLYHPLTW
jgi:hypothetical protein